MSGPDDVTIVWMTPGSPREDAAHALAEWGRVRGLTLVPATTEVADALPIDLGVADRIEKDLDRVRDAIAALEVDQTERLLAHAEATIREHPELPQAAWLRAEIDRAWAVRWSRLQPRDEERARAAWQNADALDGGRVPGIGELRFPRLATSAQTIRLEGAARGTAVDVDGLPVNAARGDEGERVVDLAAGEHHLVVRAGGAAVVATWFTVGEATAPRSPIRVRLPDGGSCAAMQFESIARDSDDVRAPGVACPSWIAAAPGSRKGSVFVARCSRDVCGPLLEWRVGGVTEGSPPPIADNPRSTWPAWATWTLLGVGAATATTVALVAAGTFESRPTETRFIAGGVRIESR